MERERVGEGGAPSYLPGVWAHDVSLRASAAPLRAVYLIWHVIITRQSCTRNGESGGICWAQRITKCQVTFRDTVIDVRGVSFGEAVVDRCAVVGADQPISVSDPGELSNALHLHGYKYTKI